AVLHEAVLAEGRTEGQVLARVAFIPCPQYVDARRGTVRAGLADPAARVLENAGRQRTFAQTDQDHPVEGTYTREVELLVGFRMKRNSLYRPEQRAAGRRVDIGECAFAPCILSNRDCYRARGRGLV